jgi:hypothetical protein
MRIILIIFTILAGFGFSGCVKDPTPNYPFDPSIYKIDSAVYLKIIFKGDTLTNYGIITKSLETNSPVFPEQYSARFTQQINNTNQLKVTCLGSYGREELLNATPIPPNPFDFTADGDLPGNTLGNYNLNLTCQFIDLRNTSQIFSLDNNQASQFEIIGIDSTYLNGQKYVRGQFSFHLKDLYGNSFPASGDFQLHNRN